MAIFVRKNVVTISTAFTANDGSGTQPSGATAIFTYKDLSGSSHTSSIALTYDSVSAQWTGEWDTSASGEGNVDWMVYGYGSLQAATEGCFNVAANSANTV